MAAFHYQDKLLLITGASSGLGQSLARAYHEAGAKVALVARRLEPLRELALQLDPEIRSARYFPADLTDTASIPRLVQETVLIFGQPVDVLVHCAGMSCYGEVERTPFKAMDQLTRLNYLAGIHLIQQVVPSMKEKRNGQVVWIGSGSSFRGIPRAAAYSASKAAVKCFCEALRSELSPFGVGVLLVVPGALKTDFHSSQANFSSDGRLRSIGPSSDPKPLARAILRAGEKGKEILVYGRYTRVGQHLAYWAPWVLDLVFRRQLR